MDTWYMEEIFVATPQKCMGIIIGTGGRNIKQLQHETHTRIWKSNEVGRGSGFIITGTATGCEEARLAIQRRIDSYATVNIKEPVPQEFVRLLIRKQGSDNFREIENQCGVKITWPKFSGTEKHVIFDIIGLRSNCDRAKEMLKTNLERWEEKSVLSVACGSQTHSKVNGDVKSTMNVAKEYLGVVVGKLHQNIEKIETKSDTKIIVPSLKKTEAQGGDTIKLEIFGPPKNCVRAEWLIRHRIISYKDRMIRRELGGDIQFVCIDVKDKNEKFQLKLERNSPKLDGFIQGQRYRIKTERDDNSQNEISVETISEVKNHLLTSLEELNTRKKEKKLIADLWCHFGKALVSSVDEEETGKTFTPVDFDRRLMKIVSNNMDEHAAYWKISFEEGVDPSVEDALPESEDDLHRFPRLKLVHTQWRYDFGFGTPSCRNVRLKAWKDLRPGPPGIDDKPPHEVKNILTPVILQADKDIKAWLCYPSVDVLRGEIMTPNSPYDCRMKLRTGSRYVTDKDSVCLEEDAILSDYLSHCKLVKKDDNVTLCLPDEKDHEIPEGFGCIFHREAKEKIFSTTGDEGECFTVIVLDEKGWDSDGVDKREQEQFGLRVVMDSWSEALLSPEQDWTPEEIVAKLEKYMDFLFSLKTYLFDES